MHIMKIDRTRDYAEAIYDPTTGDVTIAGGTGTRESVRDSKRADVAMYACRTLPQNHIRCGVYTVDRVGQTYTAGSMMIQDHLDRYMVDDRPVYILHQRPYSGGMYRLETTLPAMKMTRTTYDGRLAVRIEYMRQVYDQPTKMHYLTHMETDDAKWYMIHGLYVHMSLTTYIQKLGIYDINIYMYIEYLLRHELRYVREIELDRRYDQYRCVYDDELSNIQIVMEELSGSSAGHLLAYEVGRCEDICELVQLKSYHIDSQGSISHRFVHRPTIYPTGTTYRLYISKYRRVPGGTTSLDVYTQGSIINKVSLTREPSCDDDIHTAYTISNTVSSDDQDRGMCLVWSYIRPGSEVTHIRIWTMTIDDVRST